MKKFEITTTNMRKIIVTAKTVNEAEKIASGQLEDMEVIMMTSFKSNLTDK